MNSDASNKLTKAIINLIKKQPFYGSLALQLKRVESPDLKPATLATDGVHLFYHPDWVNSKDMDTNEAGAAHEIGHCALDHMARRGDRHPRKWNIAADHANNLMLQEAGFKIPADWYCDARYKGMPAEEIYNLLPDPEDDDDGGDSFDQHMEAPPTDAVRANWKVATIQAANTAAKRNGSVPGELARYVKELTAPQEDWRSRLRRFATETARDDYSWSKPNRMYASLGLILPGMHSHTVRDITCVGDTSGSVIPPIWDALSSEMADIHASAQPQVTRLMCCDAAVQSVTELAPHDEFVMEAKGFGSTDFRPPFEWLEERDITPSCLIYLTDGDGPFPSSPPPYPVLWVMTTGVVPPWGEHVRIKI